MCAKMNVKSKNSRVRTPAEPPVGSCVPHDRNGRIVLVGTYKGDPLTKWRGWYNYPISGNGERETGNGLAAKIAKDAKKSSRRGVEAQSSFIRVDEEHIANSDMSWFSKINELWLFKGTKEQRNYKAEFVGIKTREELIRDYGYPAEGKAHGDRYLLFKTEFMYRHKGDIPEDAERVIVRASDFATAPKVRKQLKAYLESPDRNDPDLAKRLPEIITKLRPEQLRVCEAAVQLDFFCSLMKPAVVTKRSHSCYTAISLFSGAGGLDIGVRQAGFDILACVELDKNACETLRYNIADEHLNTSVYEGDIKAFDPNAILSDVGRKPGEVDLLFGGPPCQAFSLIGKQKALEDERGMLLFQMIRYTEAIRPRVVLMEQVKGLLSAKDVEGKKGGVFEKLLHEFDKLGYVVKYKVCLAADYGVAQLRERVILVATRDRNGFEFPAPTYRNPKSDGLFENDLPVWNTVGAALSGLPPTHQKVRGTTFYPDEFRNHVDVTPERDRERIHYVPEGLYLASQRHLPEEILRNLHARDTTKYLRMNRAKPSNTLRCGEIFFHPTEDRYLTPREYMRIHGYPDEYLLKGPIRSRTGSVKDLDQHRLVANSVPPPLAKAVAGQIMAYLNLERR